MNGFLFPSDPEPLKKISVPVDTRLKSRAVVRTIAVGWGNSYYSFGYMIILFLGIAVLKPNVSGSRYLPMIHYIGRIGRLCFSAKVAVPSQSSCLLMLTISIT